MGSWIFSPGRFVTTARHEAATATDLVDSLEAGENNKNMGIFST